MPDSQTCAQHNAMYRVVQKELHKVYGTIILQLYITESSGFQQNILNEILYMT